MEAHLRAGVAVYNAGEYSAAGAAWADRRPDATGDDEALLWGLGRFAAAVGHASGRDWHAATRLADDARERLATVPNDHRGVNVGTVRSYLRRLRADPERPAAVAALVVADEHGHDTDAVERAITYARRDIDAGETGSPFVALVMDLPGAGERRPVVLQRLAEHVNRRRSREEDVEGLFE